MPTTRKTWPRHMKRYRNQAGERVQDALRLLYQYRHNGFKLTETGKLSQLKEIEGKLKDAVAWLILAGAPLEPFEGGGPPLRGEDE